MKVYVNSDLESTPTKSAHNRKSCLQTICIQAHIFRSLIIALNFLKLRYQETTHINIKLEFDHLIFLFDLFLPTIKLLFLFKKLSFFNYSKKTLLNILRQKAIIQTGSDCLMYYVFYSILVIETQISQLLRRNFRRYQIVFILHRPAYVRVSQEISKSPLIYHLTSKLKQKNKRSYLICELEYSSARSSTNLDILQFWAQHMYRPSALACSIRNMWALHISSM